MELPPSSFSSKAIIAECACLGCEFGRHSVDEIRAGRCSRVTLDIEEALSTQGWLTVHATPPDGRSLYLCDLCARQRS
jgi:hypothetical protein